MHPPTQLFRNGWEIFLFGYLSHVVRYVLMAGGAFLLFYGVFRRRAIGRKIQALFPKSADVRREIAYSFCSFAVFASVGVFMVVMRRMGYSQLYFKFEKFGTAYFWFSTVALIFLHDAWFYWTHRLMHWKPIFPYVHKVHHLSHNPTPWAAFAFHPLEAVVEAMIFPVAAFIMPIHPLAVFIWLLYMTGMNVLGHLGFEILPRGFTRHWLGRWHNTSVHHNMHHRHVQCNYGLYFNLWDRLLGTNHPRYDEEYDRVTGCAPKREENVAADEGHGAATPIESPAAR